MDQRLVRAEREIQQEPLGRPMGEAAADGEDDVRRLPARPAVAQPVRQDAEPERIRLRKGAAAHHGGDHRRPEAPRERAAARLPRPPPPRRRPAMIRGRRARAKQPAPPRRAGPVAGGPRHAIRRRGRRPLAPSGGRWEWRGPPGPGRCVSKTAEGRAGPRAGCRRPSRTVSAHRVTGGSTRSGSAPRAARRVPADQGGGDVGHDQEHGHATRRTTRRAA